MENLNKESFLKLDRLKLNGGMLRNIIQVIFLITISLTLISCDDNRLSKGEVELKSSRYFYKGEPFTGVIFDKNENNILIEEFQVENGYKKGYYKKYGPSSNTLTELNYIDNNTIDGHFVYYFDINEMKTNDVIIKMEGTIKNGKLVGELMYNSETFYRDDLIMQKYILDNKSYVMSWEKKSYKSNQILGKYKNGIEEIYYDNGKLKSKMKLTDSYLYLDGGKNVYFTMIRGKKTGEYITYFENGNIKEKGRYYNGLKKGEWLEFYENGQIHKKEFYNENGKLTGPFQYYFEDGQTYQKGNYHNGNLDGWWEQHYEGGVPREIQYKNLYKEGELQL